MPCGWEGNRRSGVALAMRHRLECFIHLRAHGLRKGDEHPAYTSGGVWHYFLYLTFLFVALSNIMQGFEVIATTYVPCTDTVLAL